MLKKVDICRGERLLRLYSLKVFFVLFGILTAPSCSDHPLEKNAQKLQPNIVIIYMDDLGIGDISAYGAHTIHTPHIDGIAQSGIQFMHGYAASATCTPSRYALLTAKYPWKKKVRILDGDAPLLIDTGEMTLPKMMQSQGYSTAIIGKWHLGLGSGEVDWNRSIRPGPQDVGFDESFIIPATQDRVPTVYVHNGRVVRREETDPIEVDYTENFSGEPTGRAHPDRLSMMYDHGHDGSIVNGISRIGFMKGGHKARWVDEHMADTFLRRAQNYIIANRDRPFFLFYSMQQPHVPRTPHPRFAGTSGMGPRGDVILEADWCVGQLLTTLEEEGVSDNTLIIFSSDNGPVLNDGYKDQAEEKVGKHKPWGALRGGKYSLFEAGTRVPFMVSWPNVIPKKVSTEMISQLDILPSLAALFDLKIKDIDGKDLSGLLFGHSENGRSSIIHEAWGCKAFRHNNFVLIPPCEGPSFMEHVKIETGRSDQYQLYDLNEDVAQQKNLARHLPAQRKKMEKLFDEALED